MTRPEIRFKNWQSKVLLSSLARQQPILPGTFPRPLMAFLRWFERAVLRPNLEPYRVDRPIFVLGLPRSGTTMLQDTLGLHPQLAFINNSMNRYPQVFCAVDYFRRKLQLDFEIERYLADSVPVSPGGPSDAISFWADWFRTDPYSLEYREVRSEEFSPADRERIHLTIRKVLWCHGDPQKRFFNKVIQCTPYIDVLRDLFPGAKLVHIIRDPRMTANSMVKLCRMEIEHQKEFGFCRNDAVKGEQYFIPYPRLPRLESYIEEFGLVDLRTTAHIWDDTVRMVDEAVERGVPIHEVRYEDLLNDPHGELGRIYEFCELPPVPQTSTDYWEKVATIGTIHHQRGYGDFSLVEEICRESMQQHGYSPQTVSPVA